MAVYVIKDASIRIGLTSSTMSDLSDHVRSVTMTYSAEMQDKSAMGSSARQRIAGLKDWTASIEFNQDYAAGEVDASIWPIVGTTGGYMSVTPHSSSACATNPRYYGALQIPSYSPITGAVGNVAAVTVDIQGDGLLHRSVSSTA